MRLEDRKRGLIIRRRIDENAVRAWIQMVRAQISSNRRNRGFDAWTLAPIYGAGFA